MKRLVINKELIAHQVVNRKGLSFNLLGDGSIYSIKTKEIMINQLLGTQFDDQVAMLNLRILTDDGIKFYPIIGNRSQIQVSVGNSVVEYRCRVEELDVLCRLKLSDTALAWSYEVEVTNRGQKDYFVDVVYNQDIGLASEASIRTNELYTSQYIDHHVWSSSELGYVIGSRQNQKQGDNNPLLLMACLNGGKGYLTDGYQFYGLGYKETNIPQALLDDCLASEVYQYEFAMPVLQSVKKKIGANQEETFSFLMHLVEDSPNASSKLESEDVIDTLMSGISEVEENEIQICKKPSIAIGCDYEILQTDRLSDTEVKGYFDGNHRHEEFYDKELCAFFYGDANHVVLKAKELITERTHGHIMQSGMSTQPSDYIASITSWMNGIFMSHYAIGNTSYNKMLTPSRNGLNVQKSNGQRIFVRHEEKWYLLGMPSAFEMGLNHCRWIYKMKWATIEIKVWTSVRHGAGFMSLEVEDGQELEFIVRHNVMAGNLECESSSQLEIKEHIGQVTLEPHANELIGQKYPTAAFSIITKDLSVLKEITSYKNHIEGVIMPYVDYRTDKTKSFSISVSGSLGSRDVYDDLCKIYSQTVESYEYSRKSYYDYIIKLSGQSVITCEKQVDDLQSINDLIPWYIHNGLIHYLTPHGLEQYSGAAWGLRDVCQGPVELLLSLGHYDELRQLLLKIYSFQLYESGDWRQWFMFDRYSEIQDAHSHNDIIVWPIKALCDYIEVSNDFSILEEEVDYIHDQRLTPIGKKESIIEHLRKQFMKIEKDTIEGTTLMRYGHGDWEDTLQPSNETLRKALVSPWTVSLIYEQYERLSQVLYRSNYVQLHDHLSAYSKKILSDYKKHLVKDGVVSGLTYFGSEEIKHFLHPSDQISGVNYRLIPMNRGILSKMFDNREAIDHLKIIDSKLKFIDGVRLMNHPLKYRGGEETFFKRAETGANFGREIGLQYTHAHIRYLQALAMMGKTEDFYEGLQCINQIGIGSRISTIKPRQSNCYYSSSDADYKTRYEAFSSFDAINKEEVGIKGGWRVYSSGPGIYLYQIFISFLGLKPHFDQVLIDPVIPEKLDGMSFNTRYKGWELEIIYHYKKQGVSPYKLTINDQAIMNFTYQDNPYRRGGMLIRQCDFDKMLVGDKNIIEVYL